MAFLFERAPGISKEVGDWSATVREVGGMDPQTVMRDDQNWEILVEFEEGGAAGIPGNWVVDAYVESIGPGAEQSVGNGISAFANPGAPTRQHQITIPVAAGNPPVTAGQNTTPYLLIITLTANDNQGNPYPMAGFEMGPVLQFYTP
jgi:hypothetical protein